MDTQGLLNGQAYRQSSDLYRAKADKVLANPMCKFSC